MKTKFLLGLASCILIVIAVCHLRPKQQSSSSSSGLQPDADLSVISINESDDSRIISNWYIQQSDAIRVLNSYYGLNLKYSRSEEHRVIIDLQRKAVSILLERTGEERVDEVFDDGMRIWIDSQVTAAIDIRSALGKTSELEDGDWRVILHLQEEALAEIQARSPKSKRSTDGR